MDLPALPETGEEIIEESDAFRDYAPFIFGNSGKAPDLAALKDGQ